MIRCNNWGKIAAQWLHGMGVCGSIDDIDDSKFPRTASMELSFTKASTVTKQADERVLNVATGMPSVRSCACWTSMWGRVTASGLLCLAL